MPLRSFMALSVLVLLCGCEADTAQQPVASGVSTALGPPGPPSPRSAAPGPPTAAPAAPAPTIAYELLKDSRYENVDKGLSIQIPKGMKLDDNGDPANIVYATNDEDNALAILSVRFSSIADSPDFSLAEHVREIEADPSLAGYESSGLVESGDLSTPAGETKWIYARRMIGEDKVGMLTYYTLIGDRVVLTTIFCHDEQMANQRPAFDACVQTMRLNEPNE